MSDTYQATYDAVRNSISGGDLSGLQESIASRFDAYHQIEQVKQEFLNVAYEQQRPSVLFRPSLTIDGNQWIALYGENLQDGVAGCGDSPAEALQDFDKAWNARLNPQHKDGE